MEKLQEYKKYFKLPESYQNKALSICSLFGIYCLSKFSLNALCWIKKNFLTFSSNLKKKYGDGWVLITGGSAGIGLAMGKKFAKEGFKILLVSRSEDKLNNAVKEIQTEVPDALVKTIVFDFDKEYKELEIDDIRLRLSDYVSDISILVNNVGFIHRALITEHPNDKIRSAMNINIRALVFLTKIVVTEMVKRPTRSLIVGSGSFAGCIRFATRTIYAPSKYFMESFLLSVGQEYKDKIDCTYLEIGPVTTELNPLKQPFRLEPNQFANSAYKVLGKYEKTAGHLYHDINLTLFWNSPNFVKNYYRNYITGCNKKVIE